MAMGSYLAGRVSQLFPAMLGVVLLAFFLMRAVPGTAVAAMEDQRASEETRAALAKKIGLDRPAWRQLAGYLVLDFGESYRRNVSARTFVVERFGATALLAGSAMTLSIALGLLVGISAAAWRGSWVDTALQGLMLLGFSTPVFWLGLMILILASRLGWPYLTHDGTDRIVFLVLPAITLAFGSMASIARVARASMLEEMEQDYVRTATAKGLRRRIVLVRHVLRNAAIPIVTVVGLDAAHYLNGAVLTESIFNYPGLGRAMLEALQDRDLPIVLAGLTLMTFVFLVVNLVVDLAYGWLDPRVRLARG